MSMTRRRRGEPKLQQRNQAVAAGEQLRAGMRGEQPLRVGERARAVVVEARGIHGYAPFFACMARHTRSGVSGI